MSRSDSEQEFVLGNKQLLSAFFVVVALLGVFFVMGYIVGQHSTAEGGAKKTAAAAEPPPSTSSMPSEALAQEQSAAPPPRTKPLADETPASAESETPKSARETVRAKPETAPATVDAPRVESAPGHTYLQVSAVKRPAADSIVKTLKDKGFPALLGESPKPELFRVLVGPYSGTEQLSKAKSDLKAIGFDAFVSK